MSEVTIAASKFLRLFDYIERVGLDVDAISSATNLSARRIAELPPEQGLPARHYSKLYKESVLHMQALNQPLPWGAGVGSEAFDLMCHCMIGARTLGEALDLASRFERLTYPLIGHNIRLTRDGETATLSYRIKVDDENSAFVPSHWDRANSRETTARSSGLRLWHALCGWLVGEALDAKQVNIAAPYLNDAHDESLATVFRCPISYDTQENTLQFAQHQLDRRLVHTSDSLREFLDDAVYQLIVIDQVPASTSAAIKSLITIDLPAGLPSFARVSEHLHMSESSLRRRLQKEHTSYQSLKDEVRCQVAIDRLVNENLKVAELSEYLGFTEPSSFVRSFKNWTGETPRSYREKMQALRP